MYENNDAPEAKRTNGFSRIEVKIIERDQPNSEICDRRYCEITTFL